MELSQQLFVGLARPLSEQVREGVVRHRQPDAVVEVFHVEMKCAVVLKIDELVENEVAVLRLPVRREPHHLVLAGIDGKSGVVGKSRIQESERMWEMQLCVDRQFVAASDGDRRRRPFADTVERQYDRLLERGREKRAGRVADVVLAE